MKNCISLILLFAISSCSVSQEGKDKGKDSVSQKRPNIVLVLTDDHGYSDVGFNGARDIITPNLDSLAKDGTVFSSAYVVHPFCGPSRAGLLTGRYPHKFGSQYNLPRTGQMSPGPDAGIPMEETFFTNVLQEAGYRTGVVGKWHLGTSEVHHPNNRGFDDFYGFLGGGHKYFPEEYKKAYERQKENGTKNIWDYLDPLQHNGKETETDEYLTDALSHAAIRFVNESATTEDPFFLYLSYNAPHVPLEAKQEDLDIFSSIEDKSRQTYAAMVYAVDRGVGELVDALRASGQLDNTLIVFLSDNGGKLEKGATNYPLKEGKGSTHEGGYRVPMFMHYPNIISKGETYKYPVSAIDFFPTFCRLAEVDTPKSKELDGIDIWDAVTSLSDPQRKDMIYALRHRLGYTDVGAREGDWKIVRTEEKKWELYDVDKDPGETKDLSSKYPKIVAKMVMKAEKWSKSNVQPNWFHDEATAQEWKVSKMPRFDETFKLEK